ncbi:WD40/YVTN/BNR-like repeat-containing protein [Neobacillus ginsengisoli]|uniref:Sortilin N-terminal domain-containing protein n=1 Tax=Neobacillus ginsengisoli TaxID=904295 RepID=A0ABT9XYM9_9BACI|nr:hypothetical protein [Neobacillus ginsengisoli]MDQ0200661.1 hypothetical protein [Neobacillus ginsengisoli]
MLKNKIMIMFLGLSVVLAGCGFRDSQNASQTSNVTTESNKQASQQTANSNSSSKNTNVGSSPSSGTSTNSSKTPPNSPTIPAPGDINMSMVTAVRLADFNTGWVGGNGWIAKTTSEGKKWAVVYHGSGTVQQIFALNHSDVWVTMNQGATNSRLLQSGDGGLHWVIVGTTPNNAYLHFTSKTTALSGNDFSQDGGKTWHSLPTPKNMVGDAYFHDVKNGWAVTQSNNVFYVKRTIDGGKSWKTVITKTLLSPLAGALIRSAGTNDAWIELIGGTGMTQTSYSVFHTTDGGNSWKTVIANSTAGGGPAPGFSQEYNKGPFNKGSKPGPLYVINPQVAFMGGSCPACDKQNSIGWTKDGGKTWVNSNVTLEGYGEAYLAMADANHGWWITTENSKPSAMYTTLDGGIHWKQVHIFH